MRLTWPQRIFLLIMGGLLTWAALIPQPQRLVGWAAVNQSAHTLVDPTFALLVLLAGLFLPSKKSHTLWGE